MDDLDRNYQKTSLNDIVLEMKLGVADWELHPSKRQQIILDVDMWSYRGAFTGTTIDACVNYVDVYDYVQTQWPARPHTDLLETLAEELVGVCFQDPKVDACRVTIRKPHVFNGKAVPAVTFYRKRS